MTTTAFAISDTPLISKDLDQGVTSVELATAVKLTVNNEEISSLKVEGNNTTLFQDEVPAGYYPTIHHWSISDVNYILVEKRLDGSNNTLSFYLLKIEGETAEIIYQSTEYVKGKLVVHNSSNLELSYPIYSEKDSLAVPSKIGTDFFELNGDTLNKVNSETKENEILKTENSFQSTGSLPTDKEIAEILTKKALEFNIPPELVKAIAWQESKWNQFDSNGDPLIGYDGLGIGIMQISERNLSPEREHRLKYDIEFNINEGLKILVGKWNYANSSSLIIPKINEYDRSILEHWYFAILAYNGISKVNDPTITNRSPLWPAEPYQDTILNIVRGDHSTRWNPEIPGSLVPVTQFPINLLKSDIYYNPDSNIIKFRKANYQIQGPFHRTFQNFKNGDVLVSTTNVNIRTSPGGSIHRSLAKGEVIKVVGNQVFQDDINVHYGWYPVQFMDSPNQTFYVASSFLKKIELKDFRYDVAGSDRYHTSTAISRFGWASTADTVVIGRGDIAIDSLTGSVLAKKYNSPLLLTFGDRVPDSVVTEIRRLNPSKIYILGGENAISKQVESTIDSINNATITRLSGSGRYDTASKVANEVGQAKEIFIATGNENSPDALSAGAIAASKQAPILLSAKDGLTHHSMNVIEKNKNSLTKVYLIGDSSAVPNKVIQQLKSIGLSDSQIERVSGSDRFQTSIAIAKKFNVGTDHVIFANGHQFIDALPATPFAAMIQAPIILTRTDEIPYAVSQWLQRDVKNVPQFYFVGGETVISSQNRINIQNLILSKY
jgi:putative cell wall-binding protein